MSQKILNKKKMLLISDCIGVLAIVAIIVTALAANSKDSTAQVKETEAEIVDASVFDVPTSEEIDIEETAKEDSEPVESMVFKTEETICVETESESMAEETEIASLSETDTTRYVSLSPTPYKEMINGYGYENGYSVLSFDIRPETVKEHEDYYEVDALYSRRIYVPGDLQIGDQVTVVFNELTGETRTLELREDGIYPLEESLGEPYFYGGYYYNTSDGSDWQLLDENSDQVDAPIYEGKLYIRKDATVEEAICCDVNLVTKEALNRGRWFNGVYFDENGYVTRLVYYGD